MKKLILIGLLFIFIGVISLNKDPIINFIDDYIIKEPSKLDNKNKYFRNYDFNYVQNTSNFIPEKKQDILNIYYTLINSGMNEFTFYCSKEYKTCLKEVRILANNQEILSNINNFVHPFNSFSHIETEYDTLGKVTIKIFKTYKQLEIDTIENKIDLIINDLIKNAKTDKEKIKNIHDYIINNSKYDSIRSTEKTSNYRSDIAYGPLLQGYAICGGYTDLMEIFLERLNIKSYKVSSYNHIWNAIFLDGKWYHLDLTWDDPVTNDGKDYLEHNYFLISTTKLHNLDITEHKFDQKVFSELKEA